MIAPTDQKFDQELLRQAFGCFPSGVTAFCGIVDGQPDGIAASSFAAVSLDPALVSVCVSNNSSTWPRLAHLPRLGLSVLGGDHADVARALASRSGERFASVDWHASEGGAVFVRGAPLWLECSPYNVVRAGDHQILVLQIEALEMSPAVEPIVFHRSKLFGINRSA